MSCVRSRSLSNVVLAASDACECDYRLNRHCYEFVAYFAKRVYTNGSVQLLEHRVPRLEGKLLMFALCGGYVFFELLAANPLTVKLCFDYLHSLPWPCSTFRFFWKITMIQPTVPHARCLLTASLLS